MKKFDKSCADLEFRWFSVFVITGADKQKHLMALWDIKDAVPEVTKRKIEKHGGSVEKYCVGMARCAEERDAIIEHMQQIAEARNWEEDE